MNILFLTLTNIVSVKQHGIYTDLIRELSQNNRVYAVSFSDTNSEIEDGNVTIANLNINTSRREKNIIKKGIHTLRLGSLMKSVLAKKFQNVKFDLIIYATPPITFNKTVLYFKKRDHAKTYLLLKDIFPQNAVDIGMLRKSGLKGIIYRYFRNQEKKLYAISDKIGCMSQANVDYLIKHNPVLDIHKVEVCPNSIEIQNISVNDDEKNALREKYDIPFNKKVFIYGGNLGKPQGIPFIIECLKTQIKNKDAFFLIVGDGTEYSKLEDFFSEFEPQNMKLYKLLPRDDYDKLLGVCDVGMIFLDHRFTIPNFPSRLLSYMQAKMPILACTDANTDIGQVITEGNFGFWCESDNVNAFAKTVDLCCKSDLDSLGNTAYEYLKKHYLASDSALKILNSANYTADTISGVGCK